MVDAKNTSSRFPMSSKVGHIHFQTLNIIRLVCMYKHLRKNRKSGYLACESRPR